jgi:hypothetical protein
MAGRNSAPPHNGARPGILALLIVSFSLACSQTSNPGPRPASTAGQGAGTCIEENCVAPNFTLKTISGEVIELYKLRGHLVVLNFWPPGADLVWARCRMFRPSTAGIRAQA